jgi:hypothetical protein
MGNVERVDKTLPLNELIFYVRKDPVLRERWLNDLEGLAAEYGLSAAELNALKDVDVRAMMDMGVHQYLIPHILRLFFGVTQMTNDHPALTAYQRAYPQESTVALKDTDWDMERNQGKNNG